MHGLPWPMQVWIDRAVPPLDMVPTLTHLPTGSLTSVFHATLGSSKVVVLGDSGASHNFASFTLIQRLGYTVRSTAMRHARLADAAQSVPSIGEVVTKLRLDGFAANIRILVLETVSRTFDIIHGDEFLRKHQAILDFHTQTLTLSRGSTRVTVPSVLHTAEHDSHALNTVERPIISNPTLITYKQAMRLIRKGAPAHSFLVQ
jgi:hypothetical protein